MDITAQITLTYLTVLALSLCASFNLDESSPVIHHGDPDSLFGYSVAMHREGDEDMLLVGAPKAQSRYMPEIEKGGLLYKCRANNSAGRSCEVIQIDHKGQPHNRRGNRIGSKSHQMFGSTVRSAGPDSPVMVCAPNMVRDLQDAEYADLTDYWPTGICYIATDNFNPSFMYKYNLCAYGIQPQWNCQLGISGQIFEDSFVVGGPGSYYWQGEIFLQYLPLVQGDWPMSSLRELSEYDDSYQGYSVARGDLDGNGTYDYATGAPNRHNLTGAVLVYSEFLAFGEPIMEITGYQIGSYFGHSVEISDLNGDGRDDLVVGAPTYTDMTGAVPLYDIGRVYIYYQQPMGTLQPDPVVIQGNNINGRFGFAIEALGDINLDGYNDLAISAPYENGGEGVVYIFNGGAKGLNTKPSQTLRPTRNGPQALGGFGFDLSGDFDIDRNGYTDLLIGAPHSSSASLYRSRPIIRLILKLRFDVNGVMYRKKNLRLSDGSLVSGFNTTTCFRYDGMNVSPSARFSCSLKADSFRVVSSRTYFIHQGTNRDYVEEDITLRRNEKQCLHYTTYIKRYIRDSQPIGFTLACSLVEQPLTEANSDVVPDVLDINSNTLVKQLPVFSNCSHTRCFPDLQVSVQRYVGNITTNESVIIGKPTPVNVSVTITNTGDEAYMTSLYVRLPQGIYLAGVRRMANHIVTCGNGEDPMSVVCELERFFQGWGNSLTLDMMFTAEGIDGSSEVIDIEFFVMSSYREKDGFELDNMATAHIPVEVEVKVVMYSASLPERHTIDGFDVPPPNFTREEEIGDEVTHVFAVQNFGPSDISTAELTVWWPMYSYYGYLLYLLNVTLSNGEECYVGKNFNPMDLELLRREPVDITLGEANEVPVLLDDTFDSIFDEFYIHLPNNKSKIKLKRATERLRQIRTDMAARYRNLVCKAGMAECYVIRCNLKNLLGASRRRVVTLQLRSRIWKNTFQEIPGEDWSMSSTARLTVTGVPYEVKPKIYPIEQASATIEISKQITSIIPKEDPPFWIVLLSICGGVLLLILILTILVKIGFFTRRRHFEKLGDHDEDCNGGNT